MKIKENKGRNGKINNSNNTKMGLGQMDACPRTYIGQTGRSLDHRLREHRRALKNGDVGSSALAEHVFSANHQVDLSKAMVIDTHNHTQTRCMLESWHIQHHQSPLNREKGTLPGLYTCVPVSVNYSLMKAAVGCRNV